MNISNVTFDEITLGDSTTYTRLITNQEVEAFAAISGDHNPLHLDPDYAATTAFGECIAHGMLTAGLVSAVIGEQLPGHGTVYLGQSLKFLAPVRPGDLVLAEVEVTDIDHSRRRVTMNTRCIVNNKKVLVGDATVLAPSRKFD